MVIIPSLSVIKRKAKDYCAYQERSHMEVIQKLYSFGLYKADVEAIIASLIEENYLNEERFAIQFAGGKFRIKKWGRIKIMQALKQRKISTYNINKAMNDLDEAAYSKTLQGLATKKWNTLKTGTPAIRKMKTMTYLLQKGYERSLIIQALNKLTSQ
ncbi:regulatory protein RecX [soil metagenome]